MEFSSMRSRSHAEAMAMLGALAEGRIGTAGRSLAANESLTSGIAELREVVGRVREFGVPETHYALNFAISRGLDYYTGMVYETILTDAPGIGSICSGGRYDNLASNYTSSKLPGVGISIGATRLFYQLRKAGLLKAAVSTVQAMVGLMDEADLGRNLALATRHRHRGGAGKPEAGQAVPVRRPCRHPLRDPRGQQRARARQRHREGHEEGRPVRGRAGRADQDAPGRDRAGRGDGGDSVMNQIVQSGPVTSARIAA
jgi:histidyl-tRNA synthetase